MHIHMKLKGERNLELKENKLGPKADLQQSIELQHSLLFRFSKCGEKQSTSRKAETEFSAEKHWYFWSMTQMPKLQTVWIF